MLQIYCPQCAGALTLDVAQRIAHCNHCGKEVIIPKGYTELESSFNFAMEARMRKDFVAAVDIYTEILKQHPNQAAAYWGRAISRYGVEYQPLKDGSYRIVCHQALLENFGDDTDVQLALRLAEGKEKEQYESEYKKIADLQSKVFKQAELTVPYDVLIVTDSQNSRSLVCAEQILANLNAANLRSLCPALEMQNVPRQDWEPVLYQAFTTASHMIYVAVGNHAFSDELLFDAKRFLYQKAQAQRMAAAKIPEFYLVHAELDEYVDIPDDLFDHLDVRLSMENPEYLTRLCGSILGNGVGYRDNLHTETGGKQNFEYTNLLRQGHSYREAGKWEEAKNVYDQILKKNPKESQVYWGMLLLESQCRNEEELIQKGQSILENANYKAAVLFANEREQQIYSKVAEDTDVRAKILRNQAKEAEDIEEKSEIAQKQKSREIEKAKKITQYEERKRQKRGKLFLKVAIAFLLVVVLGAVVYKKYYDSTIGAFETVYQSAKYQYDAGNYQSALSDFEKLGDYKDSEELYQDCVTRLEEREKERVRKRYEDSVKNGQKLENRADAVSQIRELLEVIPEGQDVLEQWYQEALDIYAKGDMSAAWYALLPWASESDEFLKIWRDWVNQGVYTSSLYGIAYIQKSNGLIKSDRGPEFLLETDTASRSVSFSEDGDSGAVVRMNGTVYVMGKLAELDGMTNHYYEKAHVGRLEYVRADIAGWKDMHSVQVSDADVVGLKENGTLISLRNGVLAKNIQKYYLAELWDWENSERIVRTEVIAITEEGTVFSTIKSLEDVLSDWTDLVDITMMQKDDGSYAAMAVNKENQLLKYNCDSEYDTLPKEDIAFVVYENKEMGVVTRNAEFYEPGDKECYWKDVFFFDGSNFSWDCEDADSGVGAYIPMK